MTRGRFITLEGGEGVGKSTQAVQLAKALRSAERDVIVTREPGGAPGAEAIRTLLVTGEPGRWEPMSELLLHIAARREHVSRLIQPALDRGIWVVSDRFADSTMAYQGYGLGLGPEACATGHRLAFGDFQPDLTLILDLAVEAGLERAMQRHEMETRYERMGMDFHRRLRDGFLAIARHEPQRCRVIDAGGTLGDVQSAIRQAVAEHFGISL